MYKKPIAALALASIATVAQAQGTLNVVDIGAPTVSPGNSILTATTFTMGDAISANTGGFFGSLPTQDFGSFSFTPSNSGSYVLSDAAFGTFTSTSITLASESSFSISYYVSGLYSSGTFDGNAIVNDPAMLTIGFTQDGGPGTAISDSASFSASAVPEPSSLALLSVGASALCLRLRRRKV